MLFITTSRRPAIRTRIFIKELERVIPGSRRIIRGKKSLNDLRNLLFIHGVGKLIVVENKKGNPWALHFYRFDFPKLKLSYTLYIKGVSLQVDIKKKRFISYLEIEDLCNNELSKRICNILQEFIPESGLVRRLHGIHGFLRIRCKEDVIELSFEDRNGKKIYPVIRIYDVRTYE